MKKLIFILALVTAFPAHAALTPVLQKAMPQPNIGYCALVVQQIRHQYVVLRNQIGASMYRNTLIGALYAPELFLLERPTSISIYLEEKGFYAEADDFKLRSAQLEAYGRTSCERS